MIPPRARLTINGRDWTNRAVGDWTISWSRTDCRSHGQPGTIAGILILTDTDLPHLTYEAEAVLTLWWPEVGSITVGRGWITAWTRTQRRDGRWRVKISCIDALGKAAATRVAFTPWPQQPSHDRQRAINRAVGDHIIDEWVSGWTVAARDVDNQNALEVLQDTCLPGVTIAETATGIAMLDPSGPTLRADAHGIRLLTPAIDVPASAIQDGPRRLDRTGLLTAIRVTAKNPDDTTKDDITTYTGRHRRATTSAWSIGTDWVPDPATRKRVAQWAGRLLEGAAKPVERLEEATILVEQLSPATVAALIRLGTITTRHRAIIRVTDTPHDIPPTWAVTAGTLTLTPQRGAGPKLALVLSIDPAHWAGLRPARWNEFPNSNGARFRDAADLRIRDLDLTLDPTSLIGRRPATWTDFPHSRTASFSTAADLRIRDLDNIT